MSILKIVEYPAEILTRKCEKVERFDRDLSVFIDHMFETMDAADGVGLAAPQVNAAKRIAVVDVGDENGRIEIVNPVILQTAGMQTGPEGCLSFPGLYGEVKRPEYVKLKARDRYGETYMLEAEGFLARAILHEIDHLDGILFTEKVTRYFEPEELDVQE